MKVFKAFFILLICSASSIAQHDETDKVRENLNVVSEEQAKFANKMINFSAALVNADSDPNTANIKAKGVIDQIDAAIARIEGLPELSKKKDYKADVIETFELYRETVNNELAELLTMAMVDKSGEDLEKYYEIQKKGNTKTDEIEANMKKSQEELASLYNIELTPSKLEKRIKFLASTNDYAAKFSRAQNITQAYINDFIAAINIDDLGKMESLIPVIKDRGTKLLNLVNATSTYEPDDKGVKGNVLAAANLYIKFAEEEFPKLIAYKKILSVSEEQTQNFTQEQVDEYNNAAQQHNVLIQSVNVENLNVLNAYNASNHSFLNWAYAQKFD